MLDVHFDTKSRVIISHLRGVPDPRRQRIRDYLCSIKDELPEQIKWLTDLRGVDITKIDYGSITDAFEFRRKLFGPKPSLHCFLHAKSNDMLAVGIMNQIVNMAEATIPNARAILSTSVGESLSIVGIDDPEPETCILLKASEGPAEI